MLGARTVESAALAAVFLGCADPSFDIDVVVRNGQPSSYVCEAGRSCTNSGFWWPSIGECSSTTDVQSGETSLDCTPQIDLYQNGSETPSQSVTPGNDYELFVRGCGHEPSRLAVSVPPIELDVLSVDYRSGGVLTVDFDSSGANVAVTSIGGFTGMRMCAHPVDGQPVTYGPSNGPEAYLSVFSMTEHEGAFGVARVWVGLEQFLDLPR